MKKHTTSEFARNVRHKLLMMKIDFLRIEHAEDGQKLICPIDGQKAHYNAESKTLIIIWRTNSFNLNAFCEKDYATMRRNNALPSGVLPPIEAIAPLIWSILAYNEQSL